MNKKTILFLISITLFLIPLQVNAQTDKVSTISVKYSFTSDVSSIYSIVDESLTIIPPLERAMNYSYEYDDVFTEYKFGSMHLSNILVKAIVDEADGTNTVDIRISSEDEGFFSKQYEIKSMHDNQLEQITINDEITSSYVLNIHVVVQNNFLPVGYTEIGALLTVEYTVVYNRVVTPLTIVIFGSGIVVILFIIMKSRK